jgi:hypothetical protein
MMNSTVVVILVAAIVLAGITVLAFQYFRTRRLRERFGPEYTRAVREAGDRKSAESKLEKLEKRVERLRIRAIEPADRDRFLRSWRSVQTRFVDDPRSALTEADHLLGEVMSARGYSVSDFESRAEDISVDHPHVVEHYRAGHDIVLRHGRGLASTEDMRQAMIHYRTLFDELVEPPVQTEAVRSGRSA